MTTPFENFVNIALGKSVSADVTLPTADEIPVFTGIGRQVTGKTTTELGIAEVGDLAAVATSGSYNDLSDKPTIPAAQVNADWDAVSGVAQILNKPTIPSQYTDAMVRATALAGISLDVGGVISAADTVLGAFGKLQYQLTNFAPVLTEANFSVAKTGQPTYKVTWVLTALTQAWAWTVPDKPINFGDLPSVATTNGNTLSNPTTGNSILGAQNSTVGGTGNVLIGAPHFGVGLNSMLGSGNVLINAVKTSLPSDSIFCVVINNYNYSDILSEINSNEVIAIQNKGLRIDKTTSLGAFFYGCINTYNASISYNISYSQFWYCSDLEFRNNPSKLFFSANFPAYSIVRGMVSNVENSGDVTVGTTVQSIVSAAGIVGSTILVAPNTGGADNRHAVAYKNTGIAVHDITVTFSDTATNSGAVRVRRITVDKTGAVIDTQTIGTDVAYGTTTFTMTIAVTTVITITVAVSTGNTGRATAVINSQFT